MNKELLNKLFKEILEGVQEENNDEQENEMVNFFTRDNFIGKVKYVKSLENIVNNPMMNQMGIMTSALEFGEIMSKSITKDLDGINSCLLKMNLSVTEKLEFLSKLLMDMDGYEEFDYSKEIRYKEIWGKITEMITV